MRHQIVASEALTRMRRVGTILVLVTLVGSGARNAYGQADELLDLEIRVIAFLDQWLVHGDLDGALETHLSGKIYRDDFLPPAADATRSFLRPGEPEAIIEISRDESFARMKDHLAVPVGPEEVYTIADIHEAFEQIDYSGGSDMYRILSELGVTPGWFKEAPFLHYPVTSWKDMSWTSSGTLGHQMLSPEFMEQQGIEMRIVVERLRMPDASNNVALMAMLWANESPGSDGGPSWKLWSVIPVPTN